MIPFCPRRGADNRFDQMVDELRNTAISLGISTERICIIGSAPLDVMGCRRSNDLDFIYDGNATDFPAFKRMIACDEKSLGFYPCSKENLIYDNTRHFIHRGMKIITLEVLERFKQRRHQCPKDTDDLLLIRAALHRTRFSRWLDVDYCMMRLRHFAYSKVKIDGYKIISLLGIPIIKRKLHRSS